MEKKTQKALVVKEFGKPPVYEDVPIPTLKEGELLVKLHASTINPSDRLNSRGYYFQKKVPFVCGIQGTGQVTQAHDQANSGFVGKRVCFTTLTGSWSQFVVVDFKRVWIIDQTVPLGSAASGIVNPVTVIGMVDTYNRWQKKGAKGKGIIHTAASSALGRMLNKYCIKLNIPLLNIVRRKQQVQLLKSEGATYIIDTSQQNWVEKYVQAINTVGFNVLFDALGGGQISQKLIVNLPAKSQAFLYGKLQSSPLTLQQPLILTKGISVSGFMLSNFLSEIDQAQYQKIRNELSGLLKNELSTTVVKQIKLEQVPSEWEESQKNATQGKYLILP